MKKMINRTHVEGLVYENELKLNVAGENAKNPGMEYITGRLNVETSEGNVVSVEFYESAITSKGAKNGKFDTIKSLLTAKTVIADGRDVATAVKIDSAISLNDWYRGEDLVSTPRNFGGFLHIVPKATPGATFETDIVITLTAPETKKAEDGTIEETGRLVVSGLIFDFANKVLPVKFIVENPQGVKFFESMDPNTFTKVWGNQVSATYKNTKVEENAFGEAKVIESEYTRREWVITGAMKDAYMDETLLTVQEVQDAMAARNVYLAEVKARAEKRAAEKGSTPAAGFGTASKTGGNALTGLAGGSFSF